MSEKHKPFIVKSESALRALPKWLSDLSVNTYSWSERRKINVGYDTKPDSDWGKYTWRGQIVICDEALFEPTCNAIEKAFGWKQVEVRL